MGWLWLKSFFIDSATDHFDKTVSSAIYKTHQVWFHFELSSNKHFFTYYDNDSNKAKQLQAYCAQPEKVDFIIAQVFFFGLHTKKN